VGSAGVVEIDNPFTPLPDQGSVVRLMKKDGVELLTIPPRNQHTEQGDAFSKAMLDNLDPPFSVEDAVTNTRWIEILIKSADEHRWLS